MQYITEYNTCTPELASGPRRGLLQLIVHSRPKVHLLEPKQGGQHSSLEINDQCHAAAELPSHTPKAVWEEAVRNCDSSLLPTYLWQHWIEKWVRWHKLDMEGRGHRAVQAGKGRHRRIMQNVKVKWCTKRVHKIKEPKSHLQDWHMAMRTLWSRQKGQNRFKIGGKL